jgi:hypothetical protein
LLLLSCACIPAQDSATSVFHFAVSGDSRNCGDIVMPAIAKGVRSSGAQFYWHLGDFRAIYTFDEDLAPPPKLGLPAKPLLISTYLATAWPDFIAQQLAPFGNLPVFLGIGNHETIPPATRDAWLLQFADWLDGPEIRAQRLKDDPQDHKLRSYNHWVSHNIDFISLDNADSDQFDAAQLLWFHSLLQRDEASAEIRTIVVGMHAALPVSIGHFHSMGDWPQGDKSGRDVYQTLWHAQNAAHKRVYVLASHSHFFMQNVYETADWQGKVLPGWIVGTAGAVRYRLPPGTGPNQKAMTDVYGYLLGSARTDGSVSFEFRKLSLEDLLAVNQGKPEALVRWCYNENSQSGGE